MPLPHELNDIQIFYDVHEIPRRKGTQHYVFIGRSNVGKSSLINKILNRKKAAYVSSKPGKTASINYFLCHSGVILIDLPGFGYAKKSKKVRETWDRLLEDFFERPPSPMHVFLLIDSRRGITPSDQECLNFLLEKCIQFSVVVTKVDKLKSNEQRELIAELSKEIKVDQFEYFPFSIQKPQLIQNLYERIFSEQS